MQKISIHDLYTIKCKLMNYSYQIVKTANTYYHRERKFVILFLDLHREDLIYVVGVGAQPQRFIVTLVSLQQTRKSFAFY